MISKLKKQYDEIIRTIDKKYISKNRSTTGCTFSSKRILNELYDEEWDNTIYEILGDLNALYKAILSSSNDIAIIFKPGIMRIEHLSEEELCFDEFHKQQFNEIFLKDEFLKVSLY